MFFYCNRPNKDKKKTKELLGINLKVFDGIVLKQSNFM